MTPCLSMTTATYSAAEVARLLGVSSWTLYQAVKDQTCPVQPIRIGKRRLVWSRSAVDRLLGLDPADISVDMPLTRGA
jgi:predicted DNA-binding transcriptional regulator AlpA